jgi:hypothetical protein
LSIPVYNFDYMQILGLNITGTLKLKSDISYLKVTPKTKAAHRRF